MLAAFSGSPLAVSSASLLAMAYRIAQIRDRSPTIGVNAGAGANAAAVDSVCDWAGADSGCDWAAVIGQLLILCDWAGVIGQLQTLAVSGQQQTLCDWTAADSGCDWSAAGSGCDWPAADSGCDWAAADWLLLVQCSGVDVYRLWESSSSHNT